WSRRRSRSSRTRSRSAGEPTSSPTSILSTSTAPGPWPWARSCGWARSCCCCRSTAAWRMPDVCGGCGPAWPASVSACWAGTTAVAAGAASRRTVRSPRT
ncbi:MAG: hypothetical protein AVDCRST_MAG72-1321, partial [uncultured Nocardioidaceae bacterium]